MRALFTLALVSIAAGCGGNSVGRFGCPTTGVVLLSWSIHQQPPTADQGCSGVQHLVVELDSQCTTVQIDPIPCISGDRWRYDGLPAGPSQVTLYAIDARDRVLARGQASATLSGTVPEKPTAIDLE
jgi:hypothetical protein